MVSAGKFMNIKGKYAQIEASSGPETIDPRQLLQPSLVEGLVDKKFDEALIFQNMFTRSTINELSFSYFTDTTNVLDDIMSGTQALPNILNEVGTPSDINVSSVEISYGYLQEVGYRMEFSQKKLREATAINEIVRALDRAAYGMAYFEETKIVDMIKTVQNDVAEYKADVKWSEPDANPVADIISILESTQIVGYPYMLTDLFLHKTQYFQLLRYIQDKEYVPWTDSPFKKNLSLPTVDGVRVHNLGEIFIEDGCYLGLDTRYNGIEIYQYIDPRLKTRDGGHIMVNQYTEVAQPRNIVTEFSSECGYAATLPNALYYAEDAL